MPYTYPENVRRLVDTPLTDAEISSIIEESDAEVDKRVASPITGDPLIRRLSTLITVKTIRTRDPENITVGEYSESDSLGDIDAEIEAVTRLYAQPKVKVAEPRRVRAKRVSPRKLVMRFSGNLSTLHNALKIIDHAPGGSIHWNPLIKEMLRGDGTPWQVTTMIGWLRREGYIHRPERGVYTLTKRGFTLLEALTDPNYQGESP